MDWSIAREIIDQIGKIVTTE